MTIFNITGEQEKLKYLEKMNDEGILRMGWSDIFGLVAKTGFAKMT